GVQTCALPIYDRHPLSGTAVVCVIIAPALRNEIERAAVPVPEAFRIEIIRIFKCVLTVHRPIDVECDHSVLLDRMAFKLDIRFCFCRKERYKWIEPYILL